MKVTVTLIITTIDGNQEEKQVFCKKADNAGWNEVCELAYEAAQNVDKMCTQKNINLFNEED